MQRGAHRPGGRNLTVGAHLPQGMTLTRGATTLTLRGARRRTGVIRMRSAGTTLTRRGGRRQRAVIPTRSGARRPRGRRRTEERRRRTGMIGRGIADKAVRNSIHHTVIQFCSAR